MDKVEKLLAQARAQLEAQEMAEAKKTLKVAAALAPLRQDIRDLLDDCVQSETDGVAESLHDHPRVKSVGARKRGSRKTVFSLALGLLILVLIGGGLAMAWRYRDVLLPDDIASPKATPTPKPTPEKPSLSDSQRTLSDNAYAAAKKGDWDLAITKMEALLSSNPPEKENYRPDLSQWLRNKGRQQYEERAYHQALETFKRALDYQPGHPETLYWLGQSHYILGRLARGRDRKEALSEALEYFLESKEKDPNNLTLYGSLAKTHIALGDKIQGREAYQEIIRLAPESEEAEAARRNIRNMGMR